MAGTLWPVVLLVLMGISRTVPLAVSIEDEGVSNDSHLDVDNSTILTSTEEESIAPTQSAEKEEDATQDSAGNEKEESTLKNNSSAEEEESSLKMNITESDEEEQGTAESKTKDSTQQNNSGKEEEDIYIAESDKEDNLKSNSDDEEENTTFEPHGEEDVYNNSKLEDNIYVQEEEGPPQQDVEERIRGIHNISSVKSPALGDGIYTRMGGYKGTYSETPKAETYSASKIPLRFSIKFTAADNAPNKPSRSPEPATPTDTAANMPGNSLTQLTPTTTATDKMKTISLPIIVQTMLLPPKETSGNTGDNDVTTDKTLKDTATITAKSTEEDKSVSKSTAIAATGMPANTTGAAKEAVSPELTLSMFIKSRGLPNIYKSRTTTQTPTDEVQANPECGMKERTCEKETVSKSCCGRNASKCCLETDQEVLVASRKTLTSLEDQLQRIEERTKSMYDRLFAVDCSDLAPLKTDSEPQTFYMEHDGKRPVRVLCEMETEGGGWTVVQRRDPHYTPVNFQRGWHDYKVGFGTPETEYWVGLQNLYAWTNTRQYEMRIKITDYDGNAAYAHYRNFYVDGEDRDFRLHVSGYRGTAGDALTNKNNANNFTADGMKFTTMDRDNDLAYDANCALLWGSGGWWYNRCSWSTLNGPHWRDADGSGIGINWDTWRNKEYLHTSTMMIRPSTFP